MSLEDVPKSQHLNTERIAQLEAVAEAAKALRPIGSPVSIEMMMRLEEALQALEQKETP